MTGPRLVRLPGGNYVAPDGVIEVFALPAVLPSISSPGNPDRVVVRLRTGDTSVVNCGTFAEAERLRDDVAGLINQQPRAATPGADGA